MRPTGRPGPRSCIRPASTGLLERHFDQVRIISLGQREDRRHETRAELASLGDRIDGHRIAWFDAIAPTQAAGFPNPAVRGCFLSHLAVLEQAMNAGVARLLVLEDDVAFIRSVAAPLSAAMGELDARPWSLAYLGHGLSRIGGARHWRVATQPVPLAHCYAVHGGALPALVDFLRQLIGRPAGHPQGGPMHVDGALSTFALHHAGTPALISTRNLAYQRPSRSDLHPVSVMDRVPLLKPLSRPARCLKRACLKHVR